MGKKLSELTLEELWQLFPIILTEHKDYWKEWYREEESLLKKFKHNRDAYTEAKTEFIIKYTELARKKYKERY